MSSEIKKELRKAALVCVMRKISPQEEVCLAVMRVCMAIIMDLCMGIAKLEALDFIISFPFNWADYTTDIGNVS